MAESGSLNRRVLIVDDSEVTRAILVRTLRAAGFAVLEARDGAEGALRALTEQPAVVISDLEMPTLDGFPLLRLLKADPASAHIPVLILTSHSEAASRYWSLHTGADAYLTKDHRPQQLVAVVERLAESAALAMGPEVPPPLPADLGPVEILARVARHLDAALLQATVSNALLERGLAASDFHDAARAALATLGEVADVRALAVAVADEEAVLAQVLLLEGLQPAAVDLLAQRLLDGLGKVPGARVDLRVSGDRGSLAVDPSHLAVVRLPARQATAVLATVTRDPREHDGGGRGLLAAAGGALALVVDNARLAQRLHESSTRDGLTRQLNRRAIYERLNEEMERSARYRGPLAVVLCDFDNFKEINDTFGHLAGDVALREGAAVLRRCLRTTDLLGRYGGEEFLAVLPQVDLDAGRQAAERLRRGLEEEAVEIGSVTVRITASFGVAARDELGADAGSDLLVSLADRRLYEAKAAGRNCVRP
jgi:two-component system cell cycle response regulator